MIDDANFAESTLKLLAYQALKVYPINALHALISDPDPIVRGAVGRELQIRGDRSTFEVAKDLSTDSRALVREMSAFILGQLGTPTYPFRSDAIPVLGVLAKDSDLEVRAAAVSGLGHLRAKEMLEVLVSSARDSSSIVRACAAGALGRMGASADVREALHSLSEDEDREVREWAALSFEQLADDE